MGTGLSFHGSDAPSSVVCLPLSLWSQLAGSPSVVPFLCLAEWFPGTQVHLFRQAGLHGMSLSLVLAFHGSWEHLLLEEKAFSLSFVLWCFANSSF